MRTDASRLYLRPSLQLNALILGTLGRALATYRVALHAFVFLSNHWHALATAMDAGALSRFVRDVHSGVGRAAQRVNGIDGKVWQGKHASYIPVLDDEAQLQRLRYLLAHGTKEGLVASPLLWPGLTSARVLAGKEILAGTWVDRQKLWDLRRSSKTPDPTKYEIRYPIELVPLPVHQGLTTTQIASDVAAMLAEVEAMHPGPHLGVEHVLAQNPRSQPRITKREPPPLVHTTSPALRRAYLVARAEFHRSYRKAAEKHAALPTTESWPPDVFLPASQFVSKAVLAPEPSLFELLQNR